MGLEVSSNDAVVEISVIESTAPQRHNRQHVNYGRIAFGGTRFILYLVVYSSNNNSTEKSINFALESQPKSLSRTPRQILAACAACGACLSFATTYLSLLKVNHAGSSTSTPRARSPS